MQGASQRDMEATLASALKSDEDDSRGIESADATEFLLEFHRCVRVDEPQRWPVGLRGKRRLP